MRNLCDVPGRPAPSRMRSSACTRASWAFLCGRLAALMLATLTVLVAARPGTAAAQGPQRTFAVELAVPGQAQPQRLYAQSHALVIGASNYTNGWSRLPGVRDDVTAVKSLLEGHGFQVRTLLDPSYQQLDSTLREFIVERGHRPDDRLVIYFAGHGHTLTTSAGNRLGYIVPVDAPRPTDRGFRARAYSMESVEALARQIESRHVLFLFDSCFSGTIFRTRSGVPDSISARTAEPVRQFITAGDENQLVPDQSIFRRQLEEGLGRGEADLNRDGYITGSELGMFLEDTVTNYTRRTQTPRYGKIRDANLDKGDFVFRNLSVPFARASGPEAEDEAWALAQRRNTPASYEAYLTAYPQGRYAGLARAALAVADRQETQLPKFDWELCGALQRGLKYGDYCHSWGGMLSDKGDLDKFYWMPEATSCTLRPPSSATGNLAAYTCYWNLPKEQAAYVRRTFELFRQQIRSCPGVRVAWDVENRSHLTTVELDFFDRNFAGRPRVNISTSGSDLAVFVRPGSVNGCR